MKLYHLLDWQLLCVILDIFLGKINSADNCIHSKINLAKKSVHLPCWLAIFVKVTVTSIYLHGKADPFNFIVINIFNPHQLRIIIKIWTESLFILRKRFLRYLDPSFNKIVGLAESKWNICISTPLISTFSYSNIELKIICKFLHIKNLPIRIFFKNVVF